MDRTITVDGRDLPYRVYVPRDYTDATAWPVILFLHGADERGSDGLRQTRVGIGAAVRADPARFPAIIVLPQAPADSSWTGPPARAALAALDATLRAWRTDPDRVYLTGISLGGHGTWYLAYRHPERFAAVVPVCGWISPGAVPRFPAPVADTASHAFAAVAERLRSVPTWIFHGEVDDVVPVTESRAAAEALRAAGGDVRYTELAGTGHNSWDAAYGSAAFTDWLFAQRRRR